ncbi:glycosyltransferase WbuB [bacterium]|nr:glycosyltransferase WbuB [bacterium]
MVEAGLLPGHHWVIRCWRALNRWALNRAHRVVVIGRCMADRVRALYSPERWGSLVMIPVWADDRGIQDGTGDYRVKWGLVDKVVVGYAGNMARFHDVMTLMKAADALRDHPRIRFVMVGDGHQKNELMAYAHDRLLHNVQFHAYVPREQRGDLLRTFDVGVVSLNDAFAGVSVPSKSFGLMAAGVPMVGLLPSQSEMAYVIQEEGCGWVVSPGDTQGLIQTLIQACEQTDECKNRGRKGQRAIATTYSLQQAVWHYKAVIDSLG